MSEVGSLVEEVKRLVLENEKLKAMIVFADRERELQPLQNFGSGFVLQPLRAYLDCDAFDMMGRDNQIEIRLRCARVLADALLKSGHGPFVGFEQDRSVLGLRLVSSAYIGVPKK